MIDNTIMENEIAPIEGGVKMSAESLIWFLRQIRLTVEEMPMEMERMLVRLYETALEALISGEAKVRSQGRQGEACGAAELVEKWQERRAAEDKREAERLIRSWSIGRQVMKALDLPLWHKKYLAIREEKGAKAEETQTAKEVLESKIRHFRSLGKNVLRLKELLAAVKAGEEGRSKLREELKQYEF